MDTVFPETQPFPLVREGSIAKCPGIGDDTANMAALIEAPYAQLVPDAEGTRTTFNVGSIAGGTSVNAIA